METKFDTRRCASTIFKMRHHESLRIRTPAPDVQDEECEEDQTTTVVDTGARIIPTVVLTVSMTNFAVFVYSGSEINLYICIVSAFLWTLCLLDAINDKNMSVRAEYVMPQLESGV